MLVLSVAQTQQSSDPCTGKIFTFLGWVCFFLEVEGSGGGASVSRAPILDDVSNCLSLSQTVLLYLFAPVAVAKNAIQYPVSGVDLTLFQFPVQFVGHIGEDELDVTFQGFYTAVEENKSMAVCLLGEKILYVFPHQGVLPVLQCVKLLGEGVVKAEILPGASHQSQFVIAVAANR